MMCHMILTVLIRRYAQGLAPTGLPLSRIDLQSAAKQHVNALLPFSSITVCCLLALHNTAPALELCDGS